MTDSIYEAYQLSGDAATIAYIRKDLNQIDTKGYWIDIIHCDSDNKLRSGELVVVYNRIIFELFPRITRPKYPPNSSVDEKRYITWCAANKDIEKQRHPEIVKLGYEVRYRDRNVNEGKTKREHILWNKKFEERVNPKWMNDMNDCEWRDADVPVRPWYVHELESIRKYENLTHQMVGFEDFWCARFTCSHNSKYLAPWDANLDF